MSELRRQVLRSPLYALTTLRFTSEIGLIEYLTTEKYVDTFAKAFLERRERCADPPVKTWMALPVLEPEDCEKVRISDLIGIHVSYSVITDFADGEETPREPEIRYCARHAQGSVIKKLLNDGRGPSATCIKVSEHIPSVHVYEWANGAPVISVIPTKNVYRSQRAILALQHHEAKVRNAQERVPGLAAK